MAISGFYLEEALSLSQEQQNMYQRGLALAAAGRNEEALAAILEHLESSPADGEALNDAGALLYALGQYVPAVQRLQQARALLGDASPQTLLNLAKALLAAGEAASALELFGPLARAGALSGDLVHQVAVALLERQDHEHAVEAMVRGMALVPGLDALGPILEKVRQTRPRIAFVHGLDSSYDSEGLIACLQERFPLRLVRGGAQQPNQFSQAAEWCQIAWLQGCPPLLAALTMASKRPAIVCRLSAADVADVWLEQVVWKNVALVVVENNSAVLDLLRRRVPLLAAEGRLRVIASAVDATTIPLRTAPPGKNLACAGPLDDLANWPLLLQCLAALRQRDPQYRLFVAGAFPDNRRLYQYLQHMIAALHLAGAVVFEGWQENLTAWLADKDFLVSARIVDDTRPLALAALAAGVKPVLHAFPGSEDFLPGDYLFRTPAEFCRRIADDPADPARLREVALCEFPISTQLEQVRGILREVEQGLQGGMGVPPEGNPNA